MHVSEPSQLSAQRHTGPMMALQVTGHPHTAPAALTATLQNGAPPRFPRSRVPDPEHSRWEGPATSRLGCFTLHPHCRTAEPVRSMLLSLAPGTEPAHSLPSGRLLTDLDCRPACLAKVSTLVRG